MCFLCGVCVGGCCGVCFLCVVRVGGWCGVCFLCGVWCVVGVVCIYILVRVLQCAASY